jgi:arylsulfatase A-like enzyme
MKTKNAVFLSCLAISLTSLSNEPSTAKPKNVLFILFDDLNDWVLHPPEHPKALTPNLDRLRESSINFTQAHVAIPVCGPSRKCLFSGLYPQTRNDYKFSNWKDTPSLKKCVPIPLHFRNNGYETYGTGKLLHEGAGGDFYTAYGIAPDYGPWPWQGKNTPENTPHSAQFETWKKYLPIEMHRDLNYGPLANVPEWKPDPSGDIPGAKGWYNQDGTPFRYVNDQDRDKMPDEISADWAVEILKQKHDHPFYLAVGFIRPHTPLYVPTKYFDMFPLKDIQLPPYLKNDLDDCASVLRNRWKWGFLKFEALTKAGGETAWKEWIQAYLACMAFADEQAGKVLKALDENGYRENTIVVLTSDNGYHIGEKDCIQKWHLWDESTRVPLFIRAPGLSQNGKTCGHPVSSVDIYPTLADLCDLPSNPNQNGGGPALDGHSLRPLLENPESDVWNGPPVALTGIRDGKENPHFSVRSRQYRYTLCGNGEEELYDHNRDPNEWTNLAGNPEYMGTKKQLREEMTKIFLATKVPDGFMPDTAQPAVK